MDEDISFGAVESFDDPRTLRAQDFAMGESLPEHGKVALDFPCVHELCNQKKLGICTMCGIRMLSEHHFRDGIRLSEYWGYLMGKVFYDDPVFGHFEGSSSLTMLKTATNHGIPEHEFCKQFKLKTDGTYEQFIESFQTKYGGKIPQDILENARKHKVPGYYRIMPDSLSGASPSPSAVAAEIARGRIVAVRFALGKNFHTDKSGKSTRLAKDLLPIRTPETLTGGHILVLNEYWNEGKWEFGGPNSWSRTWCPDNTKQEAGYFWFHFGDQKGFWTEAWAILNKEDKYVFTKDLTLGATGPDVVALQKILVRKGHMIMPAGVAHGFFGEITRNGVAMYQKANSITPTAGYFGPKTRAHLNENQ